MEDIRFQLKNLNRRAVLSFIRKHAEVTKADIAMVTGLTIMAIHKIVTELEALGLVRKGSVRTGGVGRNAATYTIDERYAYSIGIHINIYRTTVALVDLKGTILDKRIMERMPDSAQAFIDSLCLMIEQVSGAPGVDRTKILGMGIGSPGPVDTLQGIILMPPNFPLLDYLPIKRILEKRTSLAVHLSKDANAIALGVYRYGEHHESEDLVYIDIDMGIGGGLVIAGKVRQGFSDSAGEIGHMFMEADGPLCNCGNKGCLEAVSSGLALLRDFSQFLEDHPEHPLHPAYTRLSMSDIIEALRQNDVALIGMMNRAAYQTGLAIRTLINVLDPGLIILGGVVVNAYAPYVDIVRDVVESHKMKGSRASLTVTTEPNPDMGTIGAAAIVADHFFEQMVLRHS